eukprot:g1261.t1
MGDNSSVRPEARRKRKIGVVMMESSPGVRSRHLCILEGTISGRLEQIGGEKMQFEMRSSNVAAKDHGLLRGAVTLAVLIRDAESTNTKKEHNSNIEQWFQLRGARKLLRIGTRIRVTGFFHDETQTMQCTAVVVTSCFPDTAYVAKCISLISKNPSSINLFHPPLGESTTWYPLRQCLGGISEHEMQTLVEKSTFEKDFFKCALLQRICFTLRRGQGWRRDSVKTRHPSRKAVAALDRLEEYFPSQLVVQKTASSIGIASSVALPVAPEFNPRIKKYVELKKRPQVEKMLQLFLRAVHRKSETHDKVHVVDFGGGRGDLAVALASSLPSKVIVHIIDRNEDALAAAKRRCNDLGLKNVHTHIFEVPAGTVTTSIPCNADIVVGLHSCGGLADAAMAFAMENSADFIICTCCFRSNQHLACYLTAACNIARKDGYANIVDDVKQVCLLAQREHYDGQLRAQHAINSARLCACEKMYDGKGSLVTSIEALPLGSSSQRSVLIGEFFQ